LSDAPIVVIGGGAIGLCAAFYLRQAGAEVVVVEAGDLGAGASRGNAGWVCLSHSAPVPAPGAVWHALRSLGQPDAPLYVSPRPSVAFLTWLLAFFRSCNRSTFERGYAAVAQFGRCTFDLFAQLESAGVKTGLRRSGIVHAFLSADEAEHHRALQARMSWAGYSVPDTVERGSAVRSLEPALSEAVKAAYLIEGEGVLDPMLFISSLAAHLRQRGVCIMERAPAARLCRDGGSIRSVVAGDRELECSSVLIAAGVWSADLARQVGIRLPLQSGKGYSFSIDLDPAPTRALYFGDKRIAVSPIDGTTRLAGAMELSGNNRDLDWRRIVTIAHGSRPYLGNWYSQTEDLPRLVHDTWVGGRPMLPDGIPVLDRLPTVDNVYLATGHAMLGITLAPASGQAMAQLMLQGRRPAALEPFTLERLYG
jgi:glycine/D-amino acid oxidase-like deaminating enzyme